MLILTRRIDELIRIGDDISIKVIDIKGSQIRIGVDAPKNVEVHREEVFKRIAAERKKDAAKG